MVRRPLSDRRYIHFENCLTVGKFQQSCKSWQPVWCFVFSAAPSSSLRWGRGAGGRCVCVCVAGKPMAHRCNIDRPYHTHPDLKINKSGIWLKVVVVVHTGIVLINHQPSPRELYENNIVEENPSNDTHPPSSGILSSSISFYRFSTVTHRAPGPRAPTVTFRKSPFAHIQ